MTDMYQHLKSEKGKQIIKAGWGAVGITDILKDAQGGKLSSKIFLKLT